MSTVTAMRPGAEEPSMRDVGRHDRLFYGGMAVALALTIFAGFASTYYLRFLAGGPTATFTGGSFGTLVHVHGALFTTWVLFFALQTSLIASHRQAVHRRLGLAGAVLAAAMVLVGSAIAIDTAARGSAPPGMDPLAFLIVPMADMVLFAGFVTAALLNRRDKETHKRLMLLAFISIVVPGIARLPGLFPLIGAPGAFGLSLLFIVAAMAYDFVSRRRVHKAYLWGGGLIVLSVPLRLFLSGTGAWRAIAQALTA